MFFFCFESPSLDLGFYSEEPFNNFFDFYIKLEEKNFQRTLKVRIYKFNEKISEFFLTIVLSIFSLYFFISYIVNLGMLMFIKYYILKFFKMINNFVKYPDKL
jgi:hypothetical protein